MKLHKLWKRAANIYFILLLLTNITFAQEDDVVPFGEDADYQEYYLGFNLTSNMNGGLVNFALVKPISNGKKEVILISKSDFIAQALGKQNSPGNPKKINYFEKNQIKKTSILNHLWKLRYREYPHWTIEKMDPGWSENDSIPFLPTQAQMTILNNFGINRFTDYIYGDEAFRLLSSMEDPSWVKTYRESY